MQFPESPIIGLAVALGIGLLIGIERERRKGSGHAREAAGIRTFALTSLLGAAAFVVGGDSMVAVVSAGVIVLTAIAYYRGAGDDPGLTTEVALLLTVQLGALSIERPALAAGLGVAVAALLAARTPIHRFARSYLTPLEIRDALIIAAASFIVLPLLPDRQMGPFGALNPRNIWLIVVMVLAIGALAHVVMRMLGAHLGLPLAGFASGFVSSSATIGAMGSQADGVKALLMPAVAGAVLSTVATVIQLGVVTAATSLAAFWAILPSLISAGIVAIAYAALFTYQAWRQAPTDSQPPEQAVSVPTALSFALVLAIVMIVASALRAWLGDSGIAVAAAAAGFADTHAAAISVAAFVAKNELEVGYAAFAILLGFTTNTASKVTLAFIAGDRAFAVRVVPGLLLVVLAAWAGTAYSYARS